jgi:hypothetical protein
MLGAREGGAGMDVGGRKQLRHLLSRVGGRLGLFRRSAVRARQFVVADRFSDRTLESLFPTSSRVVQLSALKGRRFFFYYSAVIP